MAKAAPEANLPELDEWRSRAFLLTTRTMLAVELPALSLIAWSLYQRGLLASLSYVPPLVALQLFCAFAVRVAHRIRAWTQVVSLLVGFESALLVGGFSAASSTVAFAATCFAAVFLGWAEGVITFAVVAVCVVATAIAFTKGAVHATAPLLTDWSRGETWVDAGISVATLTAAVLLAISYLIQRLQDSAAQSRALIHSLKVEAREREATLAKLRETQTHLEHAQRTEVLAQLAAGFVHDMNNTLTVIQGESELLSTEGVETSAITQAAEHAAQMCRRLLSLARHRAHQAEVLNLDTVLPAILRSVRQSVPSDIEFRHEVEPGLSIKLDPSELSQILLNLAINAKDAMPEGGHLTLRVKRLVKADGTELVVLQMTDTGQGMTPEVLKKATQPLFTTKEVGKGTGLGLFSVSKILEQAGGELDIRSSVGQGTTIELRLPACRASALEAESASPSARAASSHLRIVVVDDDVRVRSLTFQVLSNAGHSVLEAGGVSAAVELLKSNPIDVVVSDVVMPEGGAAALLRWLAEHRPEVGVVICSGYSHDQTVQRGLDSGAQVFVSKPFRGADLLNALGRARRRAPQSASSLPALVPPTDG